MRIKGSSEVSRLKKKEAEERSAASEGLRATLTASHFLTRLGEAGVDAFTIKKVAGHSSVMISERYINLTSEGQERAFERFANLNQTAVAKAERRSRYNFR